jgi:hypothetical protein
MKDKILKLAAILIALVFIGGGFSSVASMSAPKKEWDKTFGGSGEDMGKSVQQTKDGGYIITGYTDSYGAGSFDVWLIKTDSKGNKEWDKTFGGSGGDMGESVQQTKDGGYIITGYTDSYGAGSLDVWLIKTDSKGNKEWDKTFGGAKDEYGESVQQTKDGGYIITGCTLSYSASYSADESDIWLIKTDSKGNKEWDKTFGTPYWDWGYSVQQTKDGGYIIAGIRGYVVPYGEGKNDLWLIKTDSKGNKEWDKTFGGAKDEYGESVQQTKDGGYIITGCTFSYGAEESDIWLIKIDSEGNKEWDKAFENSNWDWGYSVQQTKDGGYIITGCMTSYGVEESDVWLIKTDSRGNKEWDKIFGGPNLDYGYSGQQTKDGGYIIAGSKRSYDAGNFDVWLIKVRGE